MTRVLPETCAHLEPDNEAGGLYWECGKPAVTGYDDDARCDEHDNTGVLV